MESAGWSAARWAQQTFGEVDLNDTRLNSRVVEVGTRLAETPSGTLPDAFADWGQLKAAYRLLHHPRVNFAVMARPAWEQTRQACTAGGTYLLIEDTTELEYTGRTALSGLGHIGNGSGAGFLLHSNLAVRVERWDEEGQAALNLVGLFGQELWRRLESPKGERQQKWKRQGRERESARWARALQETNGPPPGTQWIYVADRESDIMEVFARCAQRGVEWVIRAAWNRRLNGELGSLFAAAGAGPERGEFALFLRARPGQPAREARLTVRSRRVTLRGPLRPGGRLPERELWAVEVREQGAPAGVPPVQWVLLTSQPAETLAQCRKIVAYYAARWLIEEYHKALKSGTGIEQSQLETAEALANLIAYLSLVAVRLLALKEMAQAVPEAPVDPQWFGPEVWAVLEKRWGRPAEGWTVRGALVAIARMGGFLARKSDGAPGWLTLWRGWRRLMLLVEGYLLAGEQRCG